jgi:hypothetical protein
MANPEIKKYITEQLSAGFVGPQVRQALLQSRWTESEVDAAFAELGISADGSPHVTGGKLSGIKELLKESYEIYKANLKKLLILSGVFSLVSAIWSLMAMDQNTKEIPNLGLFIPGIIILLVVGLITNTMLSIAVLKRQENPGIEALWTMTLGKIMGLIGVSFLTGAAVLLGFVALVIPGIYLAIALSFGTYIYLDQGIGGTAALSKSRAYVKGLWFDIFVRYIVMILILVLFSILVTMFFKQNSAAGIIVNAIYNTFALPFATVYIILLYEQLKKIKQGV